MTPWLEDPARSLDVPDRPEGLEDPFANLRVKAQVGFRLGSAAPVDTEADAFFRLVVLLHGLLLVELLERSWMLECLALWVNFLEGLLQCSCSTSLVYLERPWLVDCLDGSCLRRSLGPQRSAAPVELPSSAAPVEEFYNGGISVVAAS